MTFLRTQMFSLPCAVIVMQASARGSPGRLSSIVSPQDLKERKKNLSVLSCFPLQYVLTTVPEGMSYLEWPTMATKKRQHKSQKGQTHARSLPWDHNAASYLGPGPARAPLPSQECCRIATFSPKGSTLLFSGRLGGGRGTGSDHWR